MPLTIGAYRKHILTKAGVKLSFLVTSDISPSSTFNEAFWTKLMCIMLRKMPKIGLKYYASSKIWNNISKNCKKLSSKCGRNGLQ